MRLEPGFPLPVTPQKPSRLLLVEVLHDEVGRPPGLLQIFGLPQNLVGPGEGGDHEAVPRDQDLVVQMGPQALVPGLEQPAPRLFENRFHLARRPLELSRRLLQGVGPVENILVHEDLVRIARSVPVRLHPEAVGEYGSPLRTQDPVQLRLGPDVEGALPFPIGLGRVRSALGVLGGIEPTGRVSEPPAHVIQGPPGHGGEERISGRLVGLQVGVHQLGLIVEHLLEVGDPPLAIHRVAVKTTLEVVENPAGRHPFQSGQGHFQSPALGLPPVIPEQKVEHHGPGKLVPASEAAVGFVVTGSNRLVPLLENRHPQERIPGLHPSLLPQELGELAARLGDVVPILDPDFMNPADERPKGLRRDVGPPEEGFQLGSQEHGHGPAPTPGESLQRRHVDSIHVRTLFPIHLDVDEVPVHEVRDAGILEHLPLHHVAPVTRGVADGEKDGTVFFPGQPEGLLAPRVPVHRVVGVLQKVGTLLLDQPVGSAFGRFLGAR